MTRSYAVGVTVILLLATACASQDDQRDEPRQADGVRGGTLRAAVPDIWATEVDLDPQGAYFTTSWELFRCCLLRTLYSYNGRPTEEGGMELRPDLATGLPQVSADGLTWTFRLREGLRYAPPFDDTQIVALDVVRGWSGKPGRRVRMPSTTPSSGASTITKPGPPIPSLGSRRRTIARSSFASSR